VSVAQNPQGGTTPFEPPAARAKTHGSAPSETQPTTGHPAGSRGSLVSDTLAVFQREMYLVLRDPFSVVFSLIQPLVFLGLFGTLLAGSIDPAALGGGSPLQWFLPGVIVMICLFGTGVAGSNLLFEITLGSYERVLASPLRRSSILIGKSLKELAPLVVQAALVTLVAIPFGFVLYPLHVLVGLLILGVFGVGMGAFSNALAVAVRKREWMFWAVQQSLLFPLLILSGMLLPLEAGPQWIQILGRFNPLTWIVNAERALFAGSWTDPAIGWAVLAAVLTCVAGLWVGVRQVQRSTT
jgi:ABC-2 type transport system permease protein